MFKLPEFRRLFRVFGFGRSTAADVETELDFHLQMRTAELEARGLPAASARAEALNRFGDLPQAKRDLIRFDAALDRRRRLTAWLGDLGRDLGFAARGLRREPGFAVVALAVLGLGVGLTTAMVTIADRMLLRPLPFPGGDRVGVVWMTTGGTQGMRMNPSQPMWEAWRSVRQLERVEAYRSEKHLMEENGRQPTLVQVREVTPGVLSGFGAQVALGRAFQAEDTSLAAPPVGVLAWGTWQRRFGGDPSVLGTSLRVDGDLVTIVGVLRPGFDLAAIDREPKTELWVPLRLQGDYRSATVLATRRPGVSIAEVNAELRRVTDRLPPGAVQMKDFHPTLSDLRPLVGAGLSESLTLLTAATLLVLLVASANLAALLLGRAIKRMQEFGVRSALGAGRGRVARQLATEAMALGILGGLVGFAMAQALLAAAKLFRPTSLGAIDDLGISWLGLAVALVTSLLTAVGFGLAPIWAVSRSEAAVALVGRVRRAHDGRGPERLRGILIVGQLAVSLTLLVGAGLLGHSFLRSQRLPFGFEPKQLGHLQFSLPERQFPDPARRVALRAAVVERVRQVPGVLDLAAAEASALQMGVMHGEFLPEGREWPATETKLFLPARWVTPDFFRVAGIAFIAGRPMSADTAAHEVVIDERTARRYWPDGAVGRRVKFSRTESWQTIAGVVADQRLVSDAFDEAPLVHFQLEGTGVDGGVLNLRMQQPSVLNAVAMAIRMLDPEIRISQMTTAEAALTAEFASRRFTMILTAVFASLTVLLAGVGLYGTIALQVAQRRFEIGVRLAVGATPANVGRMVLWEGVGRIIGGLALGALGVLGLGRVITSMLYRATPWNGAVFAAASAVVVVVGILATWLPARRASRVDPLLALRSD